MSEAKKPSPAVAISPAPAGNVDLVAVLEQGEDPKLTKAGAALLVAHMRVELGEAKVAKATGDEARAYAKDFLRRCPMAWSAVLMGHTRQFVAACRMYSLECETPDYYQAEMTRLAPVPRAKGFDFLVPRTASTP